MKKKKKEGFFFIYKQQKTEIYSNEYYYDYRIIIYINVYTHIHFMYTLTNLCIHFIYLFKMN